MGHPVDDIIRVRKPFLLNKVSQGHCPEHFTSYLKHVRSTHGYRTRSAIYNDVLTPSCKRNSGLETFHSSAWRLWNNLDNSYRNITSHTNFRKMLQNNLVKENSSLDHFNTIRTFLRILNLCILKILEYFNITKTFFKKNFKNLKKEQDLLELVGCF